MPCPHMAFEEGTSHDESELKVTGKSKQLIVKSTYFAQQGLPVMTNI